MRFFIFYNEDKDRKNIITLPVASGDKDKTLQLLVITLIILHYSSSPPPFIKHWMIIFYSTSFKVALKVKLYVAWKKFKNILLISPWNPTKTFYDGDIKETIKTEAEPRETKFKKRESKNRKSWKAAKIQRERLSRKDKSKTEWRGGIWLIWKLKQVRSIHPWWVSWRCIKSSRALARGLPRTESLEVNEEVWLTQLSVNGLLSSHSL